MVASTAVFLKSTCLLTTRSRRRLLWWAQAHCNMGVTLREKGCLADALAAYEAAYALAPGNAVVRTNLAIALTDMGTQVKAGGRMAEGVALYERALCVQPRHCDALYNLGVAYGEMGQFQVRVRGTHLAAMHACMAVRLIHCFASQSAWAWACITMP